MVNAAFGSRPSRPSIAAEASLASPHGSGQCIFAFRRLHPAAVGRKKGHPGRGLVQVTRRATSSSNPISLETAESSSARRRLKTTVGAPTTEPAGAAESAAVSD
jgi:hypothetical protein